MTNNTMNRHKTTAANKVLAEMLVYILKIKRFAKTGREYLFGNR